MIIEINITYEEFLMFKAWAYNNKRIRNWTADKLKIDVENIQDIDFNYKRKYRAFLEGDIKDLQNNYKKLNRSK